MGRHARYVSTLCQTMGTVSTGLEEARIGNSKWFVWLSAAFRVEHNDR